ncbi:MAG: SSS family solute:Na+ symporter [Planctomycetota bacterium]|jgi:SSS family solute:Na+ symporter
MDIAASSNLILGSLSLYFLTIISIGVFYSRKAKSSDDFILASHSLSTPFVTGSVVATWLGGAVILGGAKEAFVGGFQAIVWDPWSPVLTLLFCGFLMVGIFRKSKFMTAIDYYNARFNSKIGVAALIISMLAYVSWVSAQLLSLGVIIRLVTGLGDVPATLLGAAVILTISLTGGLWALSRSDMLAFIIMTFVLLMVLPYALSAVGGPLAFIENAGNLDGAPPFSLFYTRALTTAGEPAGFSGYLGMLGVFYMLAAWFSVAVGDMGGSVLTARALAAKDAASATRGFVYGGIIYLILGMIPVIVGMCVFILKADFPEANLDEIFPWFVQHYVPEWIAVLFFVAAASAIVSTAGDTVLTSGALLGYTALKMLKPLSSDKQRLLATRIAMVGFTATGLLFGLAMGNLYNLLVFAGAITFPIMSSTYVCGILWKKANNTGAMASILVGASSWIFLLFVFLPYVDGEIWDAIYMASVPAFICSLTTIIIVSLLTQKTCPPKPMQDIDGNDISDTRLFTWR